MYSFSPKNYVIISLLIFRSSKCVVNIFLITYFNGTKINKLSFQFLSKTVNTLSKNLITVLLIFNNDILMTILVCVTVVSQERY